MKKPQAKPLTINDLVGRNEELITSRSGNEWLAMDAPNMQFFAFQGPSARIWELLETPITVGALVGKLVEQYEIDEASCAKETLAHLSKLLDEGVVDIVAPDQG